MHPARSRKLLFCVALLLALSAVTCLVMYALRQNISLFYTPTDVVEGKPLKQTLIRVGGMVVKNSIKRSQDGLTVRFKLTDFKQTIQVRYHGILPDLFREGQGIVATGKLSDNQHFVAQEVLAKHDENYMPPEVRAALKPQGQS